MALLDIRNLNVAFGAAATPVVRGVDLMIKEGEILGLVGESGSGKTVTCLSALRMNGPTARVEGGISFRGQDILSLDEPGLTRLRGASISMIFQDPVGSLNPIKTIGRQITETMAAHDIGTPSKRREQALDLLAQVGLPNPKHIANAYAHQLSGGMNQRAMIAIALAAAPDLLIADEPTTALDVTIQAQILDLLKNLRNQRGMAILLVTHDLAVVAETCDRIAVMYAGELVEAGLAANVLADPRHPYTRGLLTSLPRPGRHGDLISIEGTVPSADQLPRGCVFATRCSAVQDVCHNLRPVLQDQDGRVLRCHFPILGPLPEGGKAGRSSTGAAQPMLAVEGLSKRFRIRGRGFFWRHETLSAVDDVSFELKAGETLALVGESGSGKSTIARLLTGIYPPSAGSVVFDGRPLDKLDVPAWKAVRTDIQMVFQDPLGALNPRVPVGRQIAEPLYLHDRFDPEERQRRALAMLERLGLEARFAGRFPHQLSGGQRQRVVIARAMILEPKLLICDEPIAALDVSIQAQVVNLLARLQRETGLTILFISHDLRIVRHIAHQVAVMYLGKVVEQGETERVFNHPTHPYTEALLSAVPTVKARGAHERTLLQGEAPNPLKLPSGCRFRTRCPKAFDRCASEEPRMLETGPAHRAACHLVSS